MLGPLATGLRDGLKPVPRLTVSEWAELYRWVDRSTSPNYGRWSNALAPYLTGIMDAVNDPAVELVAVKCASQVGKSEILLNILGYIIDQDPGPVLLVQPTVEAAAKFSKIRIEPMIQGTEVLKSRLVQGKDHRGSSRKSGETIRFKEFPGGYLALVGANSPSGLASLPIRWVLFDEIDRFPASAGTEGDPIALAIQRARNFTNRKIIMVSTPTINDKSPIQEWVRGTTEERHWVPCTECGEFQVLTKDNLTWHTNDDGTHHPETAMYICPHCGCALDDVDKESMLALGEWRPDNLEADGSERGFHGLSALYSPWVSFADFAKSWLKASKSGDREKLREAVNLLLGEEFVEDTGEIDVGYLERRRETYPDGGLVPAGVKVITCGVDTQDDRLELELVGWGEAAESWGLGYHVLPGDPIDLGPTGPWAALDAILEQSLPTEDGRTLRVLCTCPDSGGHRTSEVYRYCKAREGLRVWAIKGVGGDGKPLVDKPTTVKQGAKLFKIGVDGAKVTVTGRLKIDNPGPGYCHFPRGKAGPLLGYDQKYFKGLTAERMVTRIRAGRRVTQWDAGDRRNEPFDCRVYAWAAMNILSPTLALLAPEDEKRPAPKAKRRKRRVRSKGIQRW